MREVEFIAQLRALVQDPVAGLDPEAKAALLAGAAEHLRSASTLPGCEIVPFVPGRRPVDEAAHPWLGSSDQAALILAEDDERDNVAYVLLDVTRGDAAHPELDVTLSFVGIDGSLDGAPIPGWDRRPLRPEAFAPGEVARLRETVLGDATRLALAIAPRRDLLPGESWSWSQLDARTRAGATDGADPFTFGHLFAQRLRVEVRLLDDGQAVGASAGSLFACDLRRMGSLYRRLLERLVAPDVARQAAAARAADPGAAFHPWYPVLLIGADKADLYGRALPATSSTSAATSPIPAGCCASGCTSSCSRASASWRP